MFHKILVRSLENTAVLSIWKDFVVVPVPKSNSPKTMNDFRPVALINLYCSEALWKTSMFGESEKCALDRLQFAYRPKRGVDATLILLNLIFKHLEGSECHTRLLAIDFFFFFLL